MGISNKERENWVRDESRPQGFAIQLEISQGQATSHEISDTSHFWLSLKYHKNNAASSLSALPVLPTLLHGSSQHPSNTALVTTSSPMQQHCPTTHSHPFKTQAPSRKIFSAKKSNDSSVDLKNYFGRGGRLSPMPATRRALRASIPMGGCRGDVALPPSPPVTAPNSQGGCAITAHISAPSLPFPPPGWVCYTEEAC